MSKLTDQVKEMYAAFGRGDIATILASLADDVQWEFEAPAQISWSGIRRGPHEVAGFFSGIAAEHADPDLQMTEFFESSDAVASFGRYSVTLKKTGQRVDTPVAHYFQFRDGKVSKFINITNSAAYL
jgi:ketosteroid isomerase-like protein